MHVRQNSPDELVGACCGVAPLVEGTNAVGKLEFAILVTLS